MDDAYKTQLKQEIYAYFLENGDVLQQPVEWRYHYKMWLSLTPSRYCRETYRYSSSSRDALLKAIKQFGVDWEKTTVPAVSLQSYFTDTNSPAEKVHAAWGLLALFDGSVYCVGSPLTSTEVGLCELLQEAELPSPQGENLVQKYFG